MRLPQLSRAVERRSLAMSLVGSPRREILPQASPLREKVALVTWGRRSLPFEHIHYDCDPVNCTPTGDECKGLLGCSFCDTNSRLCVPG
jgi:hypothetical protein